MKNILILSAFIFSSLLSQGQDFALQWVSQISGNNNISAISLSQDPSGNSYIAGVFEGTADFNPGSGSDTLTSPIINYFILKLDADGNFVWVKKIPATASISKLTLSSSGNLFISGAFSNQTDFDFGPSTHILSAKGPTDKFLLKMKSNGDFMWVKQIDISKIISGDDIAFDSDGNIYLTGSFSDTLDYDPGAGNQTLISSGSSNLYLIKLDSKGDFVWAKKLGGSNQAFATSVNIDPNDNIYFSGQWSGSSIDLDPGSGTSNFTNAGLQDLFIVKLNKNGDFQWGIPRGDADLDQGASLIDEANNVYLVWRSLQIGKGNNIEITKIDPTGKVLWENEIGNNNSDISAFGTTDLNNNLYLFGNFSKTVDFDPGTGLDTLTSKGNIDGFFEKFNPNGKFLWVKNLSGIDQENVTGLSINKNNELSIAATFNDTSDFDLGAGVKNLATQGHFNFAVAKYKQPTTSISPKQDLDLAKIYPNPSLDYVNLSVDINFSEIQVFQYDGLGRLCNQLKFTQKDNLKIYLPGNPGIYWIKACIDDHPPEILKVVKQ